MFTSLFLKLDELSFKVKNKYLKTLLTFLVELFFSHDVKFSWSIAKTHLAKKCVKKCKCKGSKKK